MLYFSILRCLFPFLFLYFLSYRTHFTSSTCLQIFVYLNTGYQKLDIGLSSVINGGHICPFAFYFIVITRFLSFTKLQRGFVTHLSSSYWEKSGNEICLQDIQLEDIYIYPFSMLDDDTALWCDFLGLFLSVFLLIG